MRQVTTEPTTEAHAPAQNPGESASGAPTPPADEASQEKTQTLEDEVATLRAQIQNAREALAISERRRAIDQSLIEENTLDLETARLLIEATLAGSSDPDVPEAVREIKRRKPFLFAGPRETRGPMSPRARIDGVGRFEDLAEEARVTGDRRALLAYLRSRRGN